MMQNILRFFDRLGADAVGHALRADLDQGCGLGRKHEFRCGERVMVRTEAGPLAERGFVVQPVPKLAFWYVVRLDSGRRLSAHAKNLRSVP